MNFAVFALLMGSSNSHFLKLLHHGMYSRTLKQGSKPECNVPWTRGIQQVHLNLTLGVISELHLLFLKLMQW